MAILDEGNRVFRDLNMGNYESLEKIIQQSNLEYEG